MGLLVAGCGERETGGPGDDRLAAPPAAQGFQLKVDDFEVLPGSEVQDCYFFQIPGAATDEVYVNKLEIKQTDGSHHMNVFRVKTIKGLDPNAGPVSRGLNGMGECFKSPNWADWPLIINSQQDGLVDWTLPDGVAHKFAGGEWIMLQTHYVNGATQKTPTKASVRVNFWTTAKDRVQHELGTLFATKQSIRVCQSQPERSFDGTCQFKGTDVTVVGANGHFHSRGTQFDMFAWDGSSTARPDDSKRFYRSQSWDDPPMLRSPELGMTVPRNGGVWYTCDYRWQQPEVGCDAVDAYDKAKNMTPDDQLDCCYTFGPVVDQNEHCNIFVYYYPKQEGTDINCF